MLTFQTPETIRPLPPGHSLAVAEYFEGRYGDTASGERYWRWRPGEADLRLSPDPADYPTTLVTSRILQLISDNNTFESHPRVLEIGCAEGLETVRFARMGAQVDACELTLSGVEKTQRFAERHDVAHRVRVVRAAAQELELEQQVYGLVLNRGVLDYVRTKREKQAIIQRHQAATAISGYNVVVAWAADTEPSVPCHEEVPMFPDYGGETTLRAYDNPDWDVILSEIERKPDHSHYECAEQPHTHTHIKLIAQRVGANS